MAATETDDLSLELVVNIAQAAQKRGGLDTVILDMRELMAICDFFVICSGRSKAHLRAIGDAIVERVEEEGIRVRHREGAHDPTWVVLDYGSVVVHVFSAEGRDFYDLEHLWADAPKIAFTPADEGSDHG